MKFLLSVFICATAVSTAKAQQANPNTVLEPVIVTANKLSQKQSATGKVITVIPEKVIAQNQAKNLSELLNTQAGIFIAGANNAFGSNQDFYLRGAGTGNVLIMVDGMPVYDPSAINNGFDLNSISLTQIETIEILKGAQSTLWGSDAVAGVINIITKKNKSIRQFGLQVGSYGTTKTSLTFNKALTSKFNIAANITGLRAKGFSAAHDTTGNNNFDKDNLRQTNFQLGLNYKFTNKLALNVTTLASRYKAGADAGAFTDDADTKVTNKNVNTAVTLTYNTTKFKITAVQTFTQANRLFADDSANVGGFAKWQEGKYKGNTSNTDIYATIKLNKKITLVTGLNNVAQNTTQSYNSISSFGAYNAVPINKATANNTAFYTSATGVFKNFGVEAGARFNNHSEYGSNTTFSFNPYYKFDAATKFFVNISSGFKVPTLYQLYSEYGKTNLQPEKSVNYEAGIETKNNDNSFRILYFNRKIKDVIVFYTSPTFDSYYINRDEQNDQGFEAEYSAKIGKNGNWQTNVTYVTGQGKINNTTVKNLYRRPNFVFNSSLNAAITNKITVAPMFRFVAERPKGVFDAGPAIQPAYYTFDVTTNYTLAKALLLNLDLRNLTNQTYFDVVGYNSRKFNVTVGLVVNF
jgi:vitamin B12 transporter